ncbi:MAG: UDP-N-acetylmuramoyl-L-alanyl-D-glutamate--2,6-diaminopimelate ligase [Candidatus Berkelbacteria bacterium]|nr:UDP-N-acetylmuramoyl-L-alanyl-D-glutamate--2,6-diaminopimelate ligase [Candidatus Berkelbacteria bacterium]
MMKKLLSKILSQKTKNSFHKLEASFATFKNGNPSQKIKVIGITGTKGKTTVANLISAVLDANGIKNAMETTILTKIGDEMIPHHTKVRWVTTPPANVLQGFLKKAVNAGCEYAVIEVTSQAIDQNRIHGIKFDTVVYTNLSQDHLDYHKTKEAYLEAKLKLFRDNPDAKFVINADDANSAKFVALPGREKLLYSVKKPVERGVVARKILTSPNSATFTAAHENGQNIINLKIPGIFNIQNALAAYCVGLALNLDPEKIKQGLENVELVPGRMEAIKVSKDQDFTVIVDYAHNPDSLKNVYETVRDGMSNTQGRLIAVLGATGRRDKTKRPLMGALAGHFADLVIFTNEDPYDEDPITIIEEVAAGIFRGGHKKHQWRLNRNYWKTLDRATAIHQAITEAKKNDVVMITGKGAEEVMAIGPVGEDKFIPFSDRSIARNELEARFHKSK